MRYLTTFFLFSLASCTACCGCGGLIRFSYGMLAESKKWATTTGWTMGMASAAVLALAVVVLVLAMIRHDHTTQEEQLETP